MIDPNRLARLFLDEWQDTEQPIEQRGLGLSYDPQDVPEGPLYYPTRAGQLINQFAVGTLNALAPVGQYEDGSAHLAVPGLINDGIEGWNALWDDAQAAREGAYPTFDVEQGKRSAGNSLMAAGLAATGGLAAGAAGGLPDNALASNAVRMGGDQAPKGIRAYHGSPHDFDRFDMSKIGTGEGAQAYGHGLYFAENEGVAKSYKQAGMDGGGFPDNLRGRSRELNDWTESRSLYDPWLFSCRSAPGHPVRRSAVVRGVRWRVPGAGRHSRRHTEGGRAAGAIVPEGRNEARRAP